MWNSSFCQAQRLIEKKALTLFAAENDLQLTTNNQWLLLKRLVQVCHQLSKQHATVVQMACPPVKLSQWLLASNVRRDRGHRRSDNENRHH
jgi:hypothetical protein